MNLRDEHVDAINITLKQLLYYNEPEDDVFRDILEFALWAKEEQEKGREREGILSDKIEDVLFSLEDAQDRVKDLALELDAAQERINQLETELRLVRLNLHLG
jgi:hypothetical protein